MSALNYAFRQMLKNPGFTAVAVLTLDNPPVNGLGHAVRSGLVQAIRRAESDKQVSAIVIVGTDKLFSAGADMREFGTPAVLAEPVLPAVISVLETSTKPVIAAIGGTCMGGGLELALGCHARIVIDDPRLKLGTPEVKLGLLPGGGGTVRLPRLIGLGHAMDLILTGRKVEAEEALRIGLCNRIAPTGGGLEAALVLARQLAGFPQATMNADRMSVYRQAGLPLEAALRQEWDAGRACLDDALAGAARFAAGAGRHGRF